MQTGDLLLSTYDNMLGSLDGWLGKACDDPRGDAVLEHRLAEDMFPLARQIRFCCNMPGEAMAAAASVAFGSSDQDDSTLEAARQRIAATRALIAGWRDVPLAEDNAPLALSLANGMTFDLSTAGYVRNWALPQFYFSPDDRLRDPARRWRAAGEARLCRLYVSTLAPAAVSGRVVRATPLTPNDPPHFAKPNGEVARAADA